MEDGLKSGQSKSDTFSALGSIVNAGTLVSTGAISTPSNFTLSVGSPYGKGMVIPMTARTIISGGQWVSASGGLAMAAAAATLSPLGVAEPGTTAASGGTVNVIIHGVVPMIAEGTIALGGGCEAGAGGALNCVKPHAAGSGTNYPTLSSAGSEGTVFVVL